MMYKPIVSSFLCVCNASDPLHDCKKVHERAKRAVQTLSQPVTFERGIPALSNLEFTSHSFVKITVLRFYS